jgi:hypothetical protein
MRDCKKTSRSSCIAVKGMYNSVDNWGVFDFLVPASLAYEPGCGQPEPSSTHTTLLFDSFSPLSQVEFIFVFDMLQRSIE